MGGWAGGRWGGSMGSVGATTWWHHTTASAPNVPHFAPPRGGGAYAVGPPHLPRGRSAPTWLFSTVFPPGSRHQGWPTRADLAPWGGGEPAYQPRPPPTPLCYIHRVRRTGERIGHGSRHRVASSCPPPCGVLPRPHKAPRRVRGHAYGCTGLRVKGIRVYPGLG